MQFSIRNHLIAQESQNAVWPSAIAPGFVLSLSWSQALQQCRTLLLWKPGLSVYLLLGTKPGPSASEDLSPCFSLPWIWQHVSRGPQIALKTSTFWSLIFYVWKTTFGMHPSQILRVLQKQLNVWSVYKAVPQSWLSCLSLEQSLNCRQNKY